MWTEKIYELRWHKGTMTVYWEEFRESHEDCIGLFLNSEVGKAIALHHAIEIINEYEDKVHKKHAVRICKQVFPHMKKSLKMQFRHLEKLRGLA